MAIYTLDEDGVSTNTLDNLGDVGSEESRSYVIYNETGSAVVVDTAGNTEITFTLTHSNGEVLDLTLGDVFRLNRGQAAVILASNADDTDDHAFQISANGISTTHGTSATDGGRVVANAVNASA